MTIRFGREICGDLRTSEPREWLVTNGIGGYAAGTVSGLLTRCYHGLLIAALQPPLGRTLLLAKLDETLTYDGRDFTLATNRWSSGTIEPHGYQLIERFQLEGTIPKWTYACADVLLTKQLWMQPGANTTYIRYSLQRSTRPVTLSIKALVNYRDHHSHTQGKDWQMLITPQKRGVCVTAFPDAIPFFLWTDQGTATPQHDWYTEFDLSTERFRGLEERDDHLHAATFEVELQPGATYTLVATTATAPHLFGDKAFLERRTYEDNLMERWTQSLTPQIGKPPAWIEQLVLAADQFIVDRPLPEEPKGKTVIAGYPWFGDWGRDTMISLPGLTIATGRPGIARTILRTFATYLDQGMLPNVFPEVGEIPEYNTVDAILWYFEAIWAYYLATKDDELLRAIFPQLVEVIDWHCRGTRHRICRDPEDGLLYAGEEGVQLTWMDAKVGNWVVTPRIGKPVEVNVLWYNALIIMESMAQHLGKPEQKYQCMAEQAAAGFQQFWHRRKGYCYDVIDGPEGHDESLRPNQIFAVSLPMVSGEQGHQPLLSQAQQQAVVDTCGRSLLTSYGLRSLAPKDPHYQGHYGGNQHQRDGAYHQGTVWGWLLGPFVQAHLRVYKDPVQAQTLLEPMAEHLTASGLGSLSEIFDGNDPMAPRGCFSQAWTVAEVLRAWRQIAAHPSRAILRTNDNEPDRNCTHEEGRSSDVP